MAKRVSAGTITSITSSSDFHDASKRPPQPDRDTLIANIQKKIQTKIEFRQHRLEMFPGDEEVKVSVERALAEKENFEKALAEVPQGFELVPVLYSKIPKEINAGIQSEYLFNVRPEFLAHIATHYAHELTALGVGPKGLQRMLEGRDPVDENGNLFDISIDHIVERSGSGNWSKGKTIDPERNKEATAKYPPNHFGNLIFLPDQVHQYKNKLNEAQDIGSLAAGDTKWILMMTPIADDKHSGYVCAVQKPESELFGLRLRPDNAQSRISRAVFTLDQAQKALENFRRMPAVARILNACELQAYHAKKTVPAAANDNRVTVTGMTLSQAFNKCMAVNPAAKAELDKVLPALEDARESLQKAYEICASRPRSPKGKNDVKSLATFFNGGRVQDLRAALSAYPAPQMTKLFGYINDLEKNIQTLDKTTGEKKASTPQQNNVPAPVVADKKKHNHGKRR